MTRAQLIAAMKAITARAQAENRDFTAAEQAELKSHMDAVKAIDGSKAVADGVAAFLGDADAGTLDADSAPAPSAAGVSRGKAITAQKSRPAGDWAAAFAKQHPGVAEGKAFTLPSSATFTVPAPTPVVAAAAPVGHVLDALTVVELDRGAGVNYLRQAERENAAAAVAPKALKPLKNVEMERVDAPARTIVVVLDGIPRQDIADYPDLTQFLDYELKADVLNELDRQILLGDGTGEDFEGIFNTDGVLVQDYATAPSATIRRAMARVEAKGYANTALLIGPEDFAGVELELDGAGGQYRGMAAPTRGRTVWGVPTITIPTMPAGLAVVGDLKQAILWQREQIEVRATDVAGEDFRRNQYMFRAELRAAFGIPVPAALALVKLNGTVTLPGA